ncbi:MAG: geranylgeranyl reductase family protein [Candidatus Hodarchaeales archaeon]|jgi:geranylgeranyl reductase family protein
MREKNHFDLAIIGAGPSGSLAGKQAARNNTELSIAIFEEHKQIGKPTHCSGLLALEGLLKLGIRNDVIRKTLMINEIKRARFYAPNNHSFQIKRRKDSLIVLNRHKLDQYLASSSERVGTNIYTNHQVKKIEFSDDKWNLAVNQGTTSKKFECDILISAEGSRAKLANSIGIPKPNQNWLFPAVQYELSGLIDFEIDCSELFFGNNFAPGFFGWFIPLNEESARIGIAVSPKFSGTTRLFLERFLRKHPVIKKRTKKAKIIYSYGGFVPASGPNKKTYSRQFMLIGDAAGQTKATTGGGVNIGGFCGRLAGKYASKIISGDFSAFKGCSEYQKQWKAQFEPDLSIMKYLRRAISYLPDNVWNDLIDIAERTQIDNSMETTNIDLHGKGLLQYAFQPNVITKGGRLTPHLFLSFLRGLLN